MLKTNETYRVTVVLNDGQATVCTLLSKPDATTLAAVASAQKVAAELIEAATFARNLVIPALGEDAAKTPITVAGTEIGAVNIKTESAFVWRTRKSRKPAEQTAEQTAEQAPPETESTAPKRKRRRKKKDADAETPETPETAEPVVEIVQPADTVGPVIE